MPDPMDPTETLEPGDPRPSVDAADDVALRVALADAVAEVAGVVRLEPTLKNVISRFAGGVPPKNAASEPVASDGITVTSYGQITDVRIDVAVDRQAKATATAIQDRVRTALTTRGREAGVISVHVLALERP